MNFNQFISKAVSDSVNGGKMSDFDTVRAVWSHEQLPIPGEVVAQAREALDRIEVELNRLRELAVAVVDDASRVGNGTYREVRGELIDALDTALTRENPDEE